MAALKCDICGGGLVAKAGGLFECEYCGMQYDRTRIQEMVQEIKGTVKVEGTVQVTGSVKVEGTSNKDSMLRRGELALESKKWAEAMVCYDNVLNADPECALAYLGKVCAEYKCSTPDELGKFKMVWVYKNDSYQKAYRFGSAELKARLERYAAQINENIRSEKYEKLCTQHAGAKEIPDFQACAEAFEQMESYRDCAELARKCRQKVAELEQEQDARGRKNRAMEKEMREKVSLARHMIGGDKWEAGAVDCYGKPHAIATNCGNTIHEVFSGWNHIKMLAHTGGGTVGLRKDGTCCVFLKYGNSDLSRIKITERWSNIKLIDAFDDCVVGLRYDGTVVSNQSGAETWRGIIDISVGKDFVMGLQEDGTVVSCGKNGPTGWTDVVMLGRGGYHPVAVKSDGTVYGYNAKLTEGCIGATGFCGQLPPMFLKPDGTMYHEHIQPAEDSSGARLRSYVRQLKSMRDIVAIHAYGRTLFVLFRDGRIETFFDSIRRQERTENLRLFDDYFEYAEAIIRQQKEREEAARKKRVQAAQWKQAGLCPYCGGNFKKGLFGIKCTGCGRPKDY